MSYYAVARGYKTGIFDNWDECKDAVSGYSNAKYKKFKNLEDAKLFISNHNLKDKKETEDINLSKIRTNYKTLQDNEAIIYVDGSYNKKINNFAYGIVIIDKTSRHIEISSKNNNKNKELISMQNVAGELTASLEAIKLAIMLNYSKVYLHYDYDGIYKWVSGDWKAKNDITKNYQKILKNYMQQIDIEFIKVKSHSSLYYNDLVDQLAYTALKR